MELHEAVDAVSDEATFLAFVRQLQSDRAQAALAERETTPSPYDLCGANGWQTVTIEGFLDGAIGWAEDSRFGESQGLLPDNPWRHFATFPYCGKIYE